jgi:hypothetical protein
MTIKRPNPIKVPIGTMLGALNAMRIRLPNNTMVTATATATFV